MMEIRQERNHVAIILTWRGLRGVSGHRINLRWGGLILGTLVEIRAVRGFICRIDILRGAIRVRRGRRSQRQVRALGRSDVERSRRLRTGVVREGGLFRGNFCRGNFWNGTFITILAFTLLVLFIIFFV